MTADPDVLYRDLAEMLDHVHDALRRCRSAVVLSGYASDLYDQDLFPDWHRQAFLTGTGQGPDGSGWSNRIEVLWSNRAPQLDLFAGAAP